MSDDELLDLTVCFFLTGSLLGLAAAHASYGLKVDTEAVLFLGVESDENKAVDRYLNRFGVNAKVKEKDVLKARGKASLILLRWRFQALGQGILQVLFFFVSPLSIRVSSSFTPSGISS